MIIVVLNIYLLLYSHKEKQQKWHMALGDEGKVLAILTDNILEIRTKRSEYATIGARTTGIKSAHTLVLQYLSNSPFTQNKYCSLQ